MPELPEVHTTVEGLKKLVINQKITDVWSDFYIDTTHGERQTIKNKKYFEKFKKIVVGSKIISVERRGKNILINLDSGFTIIIHMKMTGHLMVGRYKKVGNSKEKNKIVWVPQDKGPLQDPYNKYIHLVFSLSNLKHLVLSDMRKFASITIIETKDIHLHENVGKLGPDPLDSRFGAKKLFQAINKKRDWPIKSSLLDQNILSGIGNIYSDEILWETSIHPLSKSNKIPEKKFEEIFKSMKKILKLSIKHGGDSKSDYRNIYGEKGGFQNFHKVYGKKGFSCSKKGCGGIIERTIIKGRSTHFCNKHQIIYK